MIGGYVVCFVGFLGLVNAQSLPIVVTTWDTQHNATTEAWDQLYTQQQDVVDSIVSGCSVCEYNSTCGTGVGAGNEPSESGEVTLDAMIMDGRTMDVGAVGCLRQVKNAIGVAHAVMKYTKHTLLVGELAMNFAIEMGFPQEDLSSNNSWIEWQNWQDNSCQPNYRENVTPDPTTSCGPYTPIPPTGSKTNLPEGSREQRPRDNNQPIVTPKREEPDHDTIGMLAIDAAGNAASGTSTNGLIHKIAGRVGDAPIPGAGSYAENGIGAAAATGNGDMMLRLLPSYHAVQLMAQGLSPVEAARGAATRIGQYYPMDFGAIIAVNITGGFGAACSGSTDFPYHYINPSTGAIIDDIVLCEPLPPKRKPQYP